VHLPFFGRTQELEALRSRCAQPGLTIVRGEPKIGKSRLLREFVNETRASGRQRIGWAESGEASGDVLLRAIRDAYDHWFQDAGAAAEIKSVFKQMEGRWITGAGVAFGKALAELGGPAKGPVQAAFDALDAARRMGETGGVQLPRLTSEEAWDLLALLAEGQGRPVVIALNQWEEGQNLDKDTGTLQSFLVNMNTWPDLHVLVHLRDPRFPTDRNPQARDRAGSLLQNPATGTLQVGLLDFEQAPTAYENLLEWLSTNFPAFKIARGDDSLADMALAAIQGHPAVLSEWAHAGEADRSSLERLHEIATKARALHYPELRTIYTELLAGARADRAKSPVLELALLAATLPLPVGSDEQEGILPAVLGRADKDDLDELESAGLLRRDDGRPLSLGHPSRREAAERIALGRDTLHGEARDELAIGLKPHLRRAVVRVVPALVELHPPEAWGALDERTLPVCLTIGVMTSLVRDTGAGDSAALLCGAARNLLPGGAPAMLSAEVGRLPPEIGTSARVLLAMGLYNAISYSGSDSDRADDLLGNLRTLYMGHPEDEAVRENFAMGLNNGIAHSGSDFDRAGGLLSELRSLYKEHPKDTAIRENLVRGLNNAIAHSGSDFNCAGGLLSELRSLYKEHPEDTKVRELFAKRLFNAFYTSEPNSDHAGGLLRELRAFYKANPEDSAVREHFASGMNNAIGHSGSDFGRTDDLLSELRSLYKEHSEDTAVRENLASGLSNAIYNSGSNFDRADGLLIELRSFYKKHTKHAAIRELLAKGLFTAFYNSKPNSDHVGGLLDQLRTICKDHPEDTVVRRILTRTYGASIGKATQARDAGRAAEMAGLLVPLAEVVHSQPDIVPMFKRSFAAAIDLAVQQGDAESERRLRVAQNAVFGDGGEG